MSCMGEARVELLAGLPWWVPWARPLLATVASFALLILAEWGIALAGRRLLGPPADTVWQARAARAGQVRTAFVFARYGALAGVAWLVGSSVLLSLQRRAALVCAAFWLFKIASMTITDRWERRLLERPRTRARDWWREALAWVLFGLSVAYVAWLPERYDAAGLAWLLVGALTLLWLQSKWANWLVRLLALHEPRRVCVDAVARAATALGMPRPRVFEITDVHLNAFALHGAQAVGFTDAAADVLSQEELEAIAAHELGHLREPAWVRWARALFGLRPLLLLALLPALDESRALFFGMASWLAVGFLQRAGSRWLERRADAAAAPDPARAERYAQVLVRLHEGNLMLGQSATTHPTLAERTAALGGKAGRSRVREGGPFATTGLLIAVGIVLVPSILLGAIRDGARIAHPRDPGDFARFVARRGDQAAVLLAASYWADEGRLDKTRLALRATHGRDVRFEASLLRAGLVARAGDCASAKTILGSSLRDCGTPDDCEVIGQHRCWADKASSLCRQLLQRELAAVWTRCPSPTQPPG